MENQLGSFSLKIMGKCFIFWKKYYCAEAYTLLFFGSMSVNKDSERWNNLFWWMFGREGVLLRWQTTLEPISKRGKLLENSNLGEELAGEHSGLPILTLNLEILGEFQENENIRPLFQYCRRGSRKNHIKPHLWLQFYRLVEEVPSTCEGAVLAREVNGILFPISFWI